MSAQVIVLIVQIAFTIAAWWYIRRMNKRTVATVAEAEGTYAETRRIWYETKALLEAEVAGLRAENKALREGRPFR